MLIIRRLYNTDETMFTQTITAFVLLTLVHSGRQHGRRNKNKNHPKTSLMQIEGNSKDVLLNRTEHERICCDIDLVINGRF